MSNFEFNKIFAAILCAGITIMLGGFIAGMAVHPDKLEKDAVTIEGSADTHDTSVSSAPEHAEPVLDLIASADIEKGAKISKACAACHSFEKGGPIKQGPDLWGVIGRAKGSVSGFDYSESMKTKGGIWDFAHINQFLWKPKKYVDGTKMNFVGLKKPEDRAALIAWLNQQSDSPQAMPSDAEIAAEKAEFGAPEEEAEEDHAATPTSEEGEAMSKEESHESAEKTE